MEGIVRLSLALLSGFTALIAAAMAQPEDALLVEYREAVAQNRLRAFAIGHAVRLASSGDRRTNHLALVGLAACKSTGLHDIGRSFFDAALRRQDVGALRSSIEENLEDCPADAGLQLVSPENGGNPCVACVGMTVDSGTLARELANLKVQFFAPTEDGKPTSNDQLFAAFQRVEEAALALAEYRDEVASIDTLGLDPSKPEWRAKLLALKGVDEAPKADRLLELQWALGDSVEPIDAMRLQQLQLEQGLERAPG